MSDDKFQLCIAACYECAMLCDHCATACLQEEHVQDMAKCIELDMYCGEMCRLTASFIAKGDVFGKQVTKLCAEICQACGRECEKHEAEHCQRCATACKKCAEQCLQLAA